MRSWKEKATNKKAKQKHPKYKSQGRKHKINWKKIEDDIKRK